MIQLISKYVYNALIHSHAEKKLLFLCEVIKFYLIMIFALIAFALSLEGGWQDVSDIGTSDPHVVSFINKVMPKLFPELKSDSVIQIVKAKKQIVNGANYDLTVKAAPFVLCVIRVYTDLKGNSKITAIHRQLGDNPFQGSYKWVSPSSVSTEDIQLILNLLRKDHNFEGNVKLILAARRQVVSGHNTHIIFADNNGQLHSVVSYINLKNQAKLTFYNAID